MKEGFKFVQYSEEEHDRRLDEQREGNFFGTIDIAEAERMYQDLEKQAERKRDENPELYADLMRKMRAENERKYSGVGKKTAERIYYMPLEVALEMA